MRSNIVIIGLLVGMVLVCTLLMLPLIIILDKIISTECRSDGGASSLPRSIISTSGIPTFFKRKKTLY